MHRALLLLPIILGCLASQRVKRRRFISGVRVIKEKAVRASPRGPTLNALDRDEALLFSALLRGGFSLTRSVMRAMEDCIRTLVNTFYGLISAPLRMVGSGVGLISQTVLRHCLRLTRPKAPTERMPHVLDNLLRFVGRWLNRVAGVGVAISESILLIGDTIESFGTHFDAATADSFRILESALMFFEKSLSGMLFVGPILRKPEASRSIDRPGPKTRLPWGTRKGALGHLPGSQRGIPLQIDPRLGSTTVDEPKALNVSYKSMRDIKQHREEVYPTDHNRSLIDILFWKQGFAERYSYSPPLLFPILVFVSVLTLTCASKLKRYWYLHIMIVIGVWVLIVELNYIQSLRFLQRQKIEAVVGYIASLTHQSDASTDFEASLWLNVLLTSLWGVDKGGLGAYFSEILKVALDTQLALVPPGLAKIDLKRFSLGGRAPTVKGVRVFRNKAAICLATGTGCNHLVLQLDLAYLSHDMDIALAL